MTTPGRVFGSWIYSNGNCRENVANRFLKSPTLLRNARPSSHPIFLFSLLIYPTTRRASTSPLVSPIRCDFIILCFRIPITYRNNWFGIGSKHTEKIDPIWSGSHASQTHHLPRVSRPYILLCRSRFRLPQNKPSRQLGFRIQNAPTPAQRLN